MPLGVGQLLFSLGDGGARPCTPPAACVCVPGPLTHLWVGGPQVGAQMAAAIKQTTGKTYTSETAAQFYPVGGASDDWMYNSIGSELTYSIELRDGDTGTSNHQGYEFFAPRREIEPTAREVMECVVVLGKNIERAAGGAP